MEILNGVESLDSPPQTPPRFRVVGFCHNLDYRVIRIPLVAFLFKEFL